MIISKIQKIPLVLKKKYLKVLKKTKLLKKRILPDHQKIKDLLKKINMIELTKIIDSTKPNTIRFKI